MLLSATSCARSGSPFQHQQQFWHPQSGLRITKHIHKPALLAFAAALPDVLNKVVKGPSDGEACQDLLSFGSNFLRVLKHGGKQRNLTYVLLKLLKAGSNPSDDALWYIPAFPQRNSKTKRSATITAKLEEGNISAAVRNLCLEDSPVEFSNTNLAKRQAKHLPEHVDAHLPLTPVHKPALQETEEAVFRVIHSFPVGSAGSPDGFTAQNLADFKQSQNSGKCLLTLNTSFINSLLEGKCHKSFVHNLFRGLLAMDKKSGGIHSILVGCLEIIDSKMRQRPHHRQSG